MNFEILKMLRMLPSGLVLNVQFIVTKNQNNINVSLPNQEITLPEKQNNDPTFVAYENLTKEIVIQWINEILGNEKLVKMEEELDKKIQDLIIPTVANGLPWSN
jgi:hypothetical protein